MNELLRSAKRSLGTRALRACPTVFWLGDSDRALVRACRVGQALSLALVAGIAPRPVMAALWGPYVSFVMTDLATRRRRDDQGSYLSVMSLAAAAALGVGAATDAAAAGVSVGGGDSYGLSSVVATGFASLFTTFTTGCAGGALLTGFATNVAGCGGAGELATCGTSAVATATVGGAAGVSIGTGGERHPSSSSVAMGA